MLKQKITYEDVTKSASCDAAMTSRVSLVVGGKKHLICSIFRPLRSANVPLLDKNDRQKLTLATGKRCIMMVCNAEVR